MNLLTVGEFQVLSHLFQNWTQIQIPSQAHGQCGNIILVKVAQPTDSCITTAERANNSKQLHCYRQDLALKGWGAVIFCILLKVAQSFPTKQLLTYSIYALRNLRSPILTRKKKKGAKRNNKYFLSAVLELTKRVPSVQQYSL